VSLQIAILKVLVSHPEGRATIAALNSDLSILYTSGSDWIDRLKRLAARAPAFDIFGQRLVLRESFRLADHSGRQGKAVLAARFGDKREDLCAEQQLRDLFPERGIRMLDITAILPSCTEAAASAV
jgi:hypothetical protein